MEKEWGKIWMKKREWWRQVRWVRARESTASLKEKEREKGKRKEGGRNLNRWAETYICNSAYPFIHPTDIECPPCAGNWTRHEKRYKGQPERTARGYGLTWEIKACAQTTEIYSRKCTVRKGDRKENRLLRDPEEEVIASSERSDKEAS